MSNKKDIFIDNGKISLSKIKERNSKSLAKHFEILNIKDVMTKVKLQNLFNQFYLDNQSLIKAIEQKEDLLNKIYESVNEKISVDEEFQYNQAYANVLRLIDQLMGETDDKTR